VKGYALCFIHFSFQSTCLIAGQATLPTGLYYVGASRPLGSWGTAYPGGVPDEVWLNGVPVDWSWMSANGYTGNGEPNDPTMESVLILYGDQGSKVIGNNPETNDHRYICEFA
jgi:hypothetical protein